MNKLDKQVNICGVEAVCEDNHIDEKFKKCGTCGVMLEKSICNCPFCGAYSSEVQTTILTYDKVSHKKLKLSQAVPNMVKVLIVANIIAILTNVLLLWISGGFVDLNLQKLWCLYSLTASLVLFVTVFHPILVKSFYWHEIFIQIVVFTAFIILLDLFDDTKINWSLTFVVPFYFCVVAFVMSIIMYIRRQGCENILLLLIAILVLSTLQFVLSATIFVNVIEGFTFVPTLIGFLVTLGVALTGLLVKRGDLIRMVKRRFHA